MNYLTAQLFTVMRKFILFCLTLCVTLVTQAQEAPYSKYLNFSKKEFKEMGFKYNEDNNTWSLRKTNGWNTAFNILAVIADAKEEVRPDLNDYSIVVQMGREDKAAYIKVVYYNDETYHKLLTFMKDNGNNLVETSSGKLTKYQAYYGDYAIELNIEQHIISRTSARTSDPKTVKNVDESYNEYLYIIRTDVEPWSKHIEKQVKRQEKRDAKNKKKQSVEDLM
jgi:hypothetical protein